MKFAIAILAALAGAPLAAAAPPAAKPPRGTVVLPPLSYTVDKSGLADGAHPGRHDMVAVNYSLSLLDGTLVDGNAGRPPVSFPLDRLIPAWQVLVQLMRPGDAWTFYVPPEFAYGSVARDKMPANSFLIFKVELVSIVPPAQ